MAEVAEGNVPVPTLAELRKQMNYPLVMQCEMTDDIRTEAIETVVTALEKFPSNYESASKLVKETMDKKFGAVWHCIIGEGFGSSVVHESKNLLYMFFGGTIGILLFKA